IASGCRTVASDNHHIHPSPLHQMSTEVVRNDCVGYAVGAKLESSQRCTLIAWTSFVNPHVHRYSFIVCHVYGGQSCAPIDTSKPAGVTVRQNVEGSAGG